ncbi:MAG TPA: DUF86 domain-containing protein [Fimbriiglobus sp.]|jgi:uncharacterized protein with HEPN domain|nr:DUF86 domain-containing protein [Fimbriiglobus sp.]
MTPSDELTTLADMIDAAERAMEYAAGTTLDTLPFDRMRSDAILRVLGVLGEAGGRVSQQTSQRFPLLPWREMKGMRNVLIHRYDRVAWQIVWDTVTIHIPAMMPALREAHQQLLSEQPPQPPEAP